MKQSAIKRAQQYAAIGGIIIAIVVSAICTSSAQIKPVVLLHGQVMSEQTGEPAFVRYDVSVNGKISTRGKTRTADGGFQLILKSGAEYILRFYANKIVVSVDTVRIPQVESYKEMQRRFIIPFVHSEAHNDIFKLGRCSPNPVTSKGRIGYTLYVEGHVELALYTMAGEKITTIVDEQRAPGTYRAEFDAAHLESGMYLYSLQMNGFTRAQRMRIRR